MPQINIDSQNDADPSFPLPTIFVGVDAVLENINTNNQNLQILLRKVTVIYEKLNVFSEETLDRPDNTPAGLTMKTVPQEGYLTKINDNLSSQADWLKQAIDKTDSLYASLFR